MLLTRSAVESSTKTDSPVDPAPARGLHGELVSRFRSLNGESGSTSSIDKLTSGAGTSGLGVAEDEDGKTIEDMLAELGPEDSWAIPKDEAGQIDELLETARSTLKQSEETKQDAATPTPQHGEVVSDDEEIHSIGNDVRQARARMSGKLEPTENELEDDAAEYLAQVLEEIKHEPKAKMGHETADSQHPDEASHQADVQSSTTTGFDLPSAPANEPELPPPYSEVTVDDALASRFANLGLPAVPTTLKSSAPKATTKQQPKGYTDEEIDSWCVICSEDATLSCIGCDGDLYCTNCWLEGHKGPDAGYEERKHKARQHTKGGGLKRQPARQIMGV